MRRGVSLGSSNRSPGAGGRASSLASSGGGGDDQKWLVVGFQRLRGGVGGRGQGDAQDALAYRPGGSVASS